MSKKPTYKELEQKIEVLHSELCKIESRAREIQKLALIGNWEWNIEQKTLIWSDELCKIFGLDPASFRPSFKAFEAVIHPDDLKGFLKQRKVMLNQKKKTCIDYRIVLQEGSIRYVQERTQLILNHQDEVCSVMGTVQDITERKKIETALQVTENKYKPLSKMLRLMCDNVPDMIWAKDLEKRFIFVNHAICRHLLNAADTEEPIGKTDLFFAERERLSHPNDPNWHTFGELCQDSDAITMERKMPQQFEEFGNIRGEYLFLDVHKAPFVDETGEMIGTVGSARDVTEARKIDGELKKLNEALEEKIKKRTSSLEDVNTALRVLLEKREEDKNQVGTNIYANFKTLIQPLLNQLRKSLTQKTQEEIVNILESTIREMTTPFSKKLSDPLLGLTPTEIQVAMLVKEGKTNKDIAKLLNKSIRAVTSHRNNMRQKLGLKNKKINLRTYLSSLN